MERLISEGDVVVLNKLAYGPIIPKRISDVPYGELISNVLNKDFEFPLNDKKLRGFGDIRRNDIVVFKKATNNSSNLIKRVIGLSGERIEIINTKVYVDGTLLDELATYVFEYINIEPNSTTVTYSNDEVMTQNIQLLRSIHKANENIDNIYPSEKIYEWTRDNYGSVIVPKKGAVIELDDETFQIYRVLICNELNQKFENLKDYVAKNNTNSYTFKSNYYFLMGDNRHFSSDSRSIGFISSENILGKLFLIL